MKITLIILLALFFTNIGSGQDQVVSSKQLNQLEIDLVFTDSLKSKLQIEYSIYRIHEYNDKAGKHFIVMTENKVESEKEGERFDSIKAYCYSIIDGKYRLLWSLNDFILPNGNDVSEEFSIWFWSKYFKLEDYDGDGIIDPILVYGTSGINGTDDGRIKILIYHKGKKRAIRHQNGTLDFERNTQVDKSYYNLPAKIQERVKNIMKKITENGHGIFPSGWQRAMINKKLKFNEN